MVLAPVAVNLRLVRLEQAFVREYRHFGRALAITFFGGSILLDGSRL